VFFRELISPADSLPRPELLANPSIQIRALKAPPKILDTSTPVKFVLFAPFKAAYQLISLLYMLLYTISPTTQFLLLQNPPAIPTLVVAKIVSLLRGQKVVVDWHNFGYSILKMKLKDHPIVWMTKLSVPPFLLTHITHLANLGISYEIIFGRGAYTNFTVTHSMNLHLRESWGIKTRIHTLHDRPPSHFQPFSASARASFLRSHPTTIPFADKILSGRTKLVLSSTSWTPDEDFSIFLSALLSYDRRASAENFLCPNSVPDVLAIITGKGPLRDSYLARIADLEFQYVAIESVWLEAEHYPEMIACADLGVSLHTSSSGMDLPMKVVDLFGVGVPVAAVRFACVGELVKEGENGVTFETDEELAGTLVRLFDPRKTKELETLKAGAMRETMSRWDDNWDKIAAPVFGL
jgi:beta-1,4-mannosyltransferase